MRALGLNACRLAYLRAPDGGAEVFDDVRFEVVEWAAEALADPSGNRMRVPVRMRWRIAGAGELEATVDSPWRYGHGYVAAYRHTGMWRGTPVSGSGYCEWVDVEDWGARLSSRPPLEAPPQARGG